jgi:outer membrane protein OmpA-like peptidoglycan-associated protein
MKNILYLFLFLSISQPVLAQKSRAEKQFESKGYGVYLEMQSKEDIQKLDRPTLIRMAKSSQKTGDSRSAEKLYQILIEQEDNEPLYHLYYAQALQTNGRYLDARNHFRICDEQLQEKANGKAYDQRAKLGWEACNQIAALRSIGPVEVNNESALNSPKIEFSPMYYQGGILFVSTRTKTEQKDRWLNDNYMDLYYAKKGDDGNFETPEFFADELNTQLHEGPSVFSRDQKTIYFTRNDFYKGRRGKSKDGTTKLNLYMADFVAGEWTNEREFPFNKAEVDQAHPALTKDETILVFASNEKGGYGGMDLWASKLENGEWQKPVNLGSRINTPGDDVFPFIHEDGTLFFASNGWSSLGGLDVFMATQVYNHPDSLWEFPFNVGSPINSSGDDFGLIINKDKTEGYYTSSREEGMGEDDIYHFKIKEGLDGVAPLPSMNIDVCIYDDDSRLRLENAKVSVKRDTEREEPMVESITNEYGYTTCKLRVGDSYFIEVIRAGYFKVSDYFIMPKEVDGLDEYCIGLTRDGTIALEEEMVAETPSTRKMYNTTDIPPVNYTYDPNVPLPPTHVRGRVVNVEYDKPLPKTSVILLNRCSGEELVMEVADNGEFGFPLECGCEYVVKSKKNKFFGDNQVISLLTEEDCNRGIELEMAMKPNFDRFGDPFLLTNKSIDQSIKEGDVIELKSIFYDYDKWNIRPDAASDLKDLVVIMSKYPSMEIELSSHTDARGSEGYNRVLAEKRAVSAKAYLVQKGIAANRVEAVGHGEDRLKNKCKLCSESDHQENRRTEVLITKLEKVE